MIEELLRKIEHYQEYQQLKHHTTFYSHYIDDLFKDIAVDVDISKFTIPLVIQTNYQRLVDKVVFEYAKQFNRLLYFIPLSQKRWKERIETGPKEALLYLTEIHALKKAEKEKLLEQLKRSDFILCATCEVESDYETITLNTDTKLYDHNEILAIDDYVKFIVNAFQYKFPDTELSRKLGISRKSLWEKRKKYGIFKKGKAKG